MERTCAHRHVVGLQYHAPVVGPIALQGQNKILESPGTFSLSQATDPCAKGRGSIASIGCIATKRVLEGHLSAQCALK